MAVPQIRVAADTITCTSGSSPAVQQQTLTGYGLLNKDMRGHLPKQTFWAAISNLPRYLHLRFEFPNIQLNRLQINTSPNIPTDALTPDYNYGK